MEILLGCVSVMEILLCCASVMEILLCCASVMEILLCCTSVMEILLCCASVVEILLGSLWWRHNERDCMSNHQPHHWLLDRLLGRKSKETSKLRVIGLCVGKSPGLVNYPHKGPVTRKIFPFDDVIMIIGMCISNGDTAVSSISNGDTAVLL